VRYKSSEENKSVQFDVPVLDADVEVQEASENLRWAAAVAQFGMLLRNSDHRGEANWESTASLARGAMGPDEGGERAEFLHLVRTAAKLEDAATTSALH
jgi:Ca-activated chloride channel family protein